MSRKQMSRKESGLPQNNHAKSETIWYRGFESESGVSTLSYPYPSSLHQTETLVKFLLTLDTAQLKSSFNCCGQLNQLLYGEDK